MKILQYLLIMIGVICLSISGWEWYENHNAEQKALATAREMVNQFPDSNTYKNQQKDKKDVNRNEVIGLLEIPSLKKQLPIIEGTDLPELNKGVGHYIDSAFPGENGQIFLAGHRDTVFKRLGNLKIGEKIIINMSYGSFEYKMVESKIVKSDDRSIINLNSKKDSLVLATCYPFLFVGNAPDRYIIYAEPINKKD